MGQILSTRADLIPSPLRESLCQLQDKVTPMPAGRVSRILDRSGLMMKIQNFRAAPVAGGTIAQVHEATRADDGRPLALKIQRPGVRSRLEADGRLVQFLGLFAARLPSLASIPLRVALAEASEVLIRQTDFALEARNHARLQRLFDGDPDVHVPPLHDDLCTAKILVTDFVGGLRKLDDPELPESMARQALLHGCRALYKMIFEAGFLHCDMHPGNVFVAPEGRLVIVDAGFMSEIDHLTRRAFAEFFYAIAVRDGARAARIVRETASRLPADLDINAFDREITVLIKRVGGLDARNFQVTIFIGELFAIQRRHRIFGTSRFTLIILSLLVYEGVAKQRYPDLDFQKEAIPFVMAAMARRTPARASAGRDPQNFQPVAG